MIRNIYHYAITYTCMHSEVHTYIYNTHNMHTRTRSHTHTHTHPHLHTHLHTHPHPPTHTYTPTHTPTQILGNTLTQLCAHTRAHMHTHTYTHTYVPTHPCTYIMSRCLVNCVHCEREILSQCLEERVSHYMHHNGLHLPLGLSSVLVWLLWYLYSVVQIRVFVCCFYLCRGQTYCVFVRNGLWGSSAWRWLWSTLCGVRLFGFVSELNLRFLMYFIPSPKHSE